MEVYLLRHAIAEERASSGKDADRRLTDDGRKRLRKVLEHARKANVTPTLIISSPLKRAVETAELAAKDLGYSSKIAISEALVPDSSPEKIWAELRAHRDEPAILLTGHEPLFSATASWMLGSSRSMVDFKKAGLMRVDFETLGPEPRGVLEWMITPRLA